MTRPPTRAPHAAGLFDELIVDNFAGGGGASLGIERALGRAVDVAINHDAQAVALHRANHPHTIHYRSDVWEVDPCEVTRGRPVGLTWFSPDCKHFSKAKGGRPVEKKIRGLAWVVARWAAKVKPRVILLENVREFETWGPLGPDDRPCPRRKGVTFKRWVSTLRNLGYAVEWRELNAADFGAPTHRRRLFLVARCDGEPIAWPEPTHGPGRRPYRAAAECIDWSLPCPSIFLTREEGRLAGCKRPLAEKTMRRIAMGLKRFVLDNPRPFIVRCDHGGDEFRGQGLDRPLATVAGDHGFALTTPYLMAQYGEAPHQETRGQRADEPFRTITPRAGGGFSLIAPSVVQYNQEKAGEVRGLAADEPLNVVTPANRFALAAAFLNKHYGGVVGHGVERPIGTITARDHHSITLAHLTKFYGTNVGADPSSPMPTVTGGGNHVGEVRAFLTKYYSTNRTGQALDEPLHTITAADRFGLVTVAGQDYAIVDIGLRILRPRELYRAQGFPDSYRIAIEAGGRPLSAEAQVRLCGNSVCPDVAEALVRANFAGAAAEPARRRRRGVVA